MSNPKPPPGNRSRKALTALDGNDEFSVFSLEPEAHKPLVSLKEDAATGRPEDTRVSRTVLRFFRKIFGE